MKDEEIDRLIKENEEVLKSFERINLITRKTYEKIEIYAYFKKMLAVPMPRMEAYAATAVKFNKSEDAIIRIITKIH